MAFIHFPVRLNERWSAVSSGWAQLVKVGARSDIRMDAPLAPMFYQGSVHIEFTKINLRGGGADGHFYWKIWENGDGAERENPVGMKSVFFNAEAALFCLPWFIRAQWTPYLCVLCLLHTSRWFLYSLFDSLLAFATDQLAGWLWLIHISIFPAFIILCPAVFKLNAKIQKHPKALSFLKLKRFWIPRGLYYIIRECVCGNKGWDVS